MQDRKTGSESKARKKRSDTGGIMATDRDFAILRYINEQYAIRFNHFAVLFRLYSPRKEAFEGQLLSETTAGATTLLYRMRRAGWLESKKLEYKKPPWIWLTRQALADIDSKHKYKEPVLAKLAHTHATTGIRLYLETEHEGLVWKSERTINREYWEKTKKRVKHLVDGEVAFKDKKIAIEIELSYKGTDRTRDIIHWLLDRYDIVYYYASRRCFNPVQKVINSIESERVIIRPLETYLDKYEPTSRQE